MSAPLIIKGASPLGERAQDLYVVDGVLVDEQPAKAEVIGLTAAPGPTSFPAAPAWTRSTTESAP